MGTRLKLFLLLEEDKEMTTQKIPPLQLQSITLASRLVVGTGKYPDYEIMQTALEESGCSAVTVAVRRERLVDDKALTTSRPWANCYIFRCLYPIPNAEVPHALVAYALAPLSVCQSAGVRVRGSARCDVGMV